MQAPWDYSADVPTPGNPLLPNLPTEEGRELGREMARLATIGRLHSKNLPEPCHDCAFLGTRPNGCGPTLMDALKCALEGETFYCHVDDGKPCAGYLALKEAR